MSKNNEKLLKNLIYTKFESDDPESNENQGYDEVEINEVADNGVLKLYEIKNEGMIDDDFIVNECIPELFPDFKPDTKNKTYLIGDKNGIYMG